ncbi:hypothetical protein SCLCIDRAFT_31840 [Scleroderma citrinum Foug A]|uniref:Protein kinase domain-containing protein n=1 Tax=Scleroderma citrinum Foug A TaxID=1036808 RepID=A0A0C3CY35_9AGAM|nr:hypothetical protein SCLCIDRAFT_31840 [Scleroderma citrinum Foug A]
MARQGSPSHQVNGANDDQSTDHNIKLDPSDPREVLKELAKRALRYSINLDGLVDKDNVSLVRGGFAVVSSGILRREGVLIERAGLYGNSKTIKVAIKTPRGGFPGDVETIKKFLKEVHAWSKLAHANVLPLIGITTQFDLTVSVISLWKEKGDARHYVMDKSVDPRPLIQDSASGLCYLHNRSPSPLYHGDVKGLNVLISEEGRALLTDFGLSCLTNSSFSVSTPGQFGGTLPWMSPEMLSVAVPVPPPTAARDVWAFAMMALELFTREDPFHPISGPFIMLRILRGPPDRPSAEDTCFRLTDEWWSIFSECWHTEPSMRPTMSQVAKRIGQIMPSVR